MPESPRWLVSAGRRTEATSVLQRIRGTSDVRAEMEEMVESATDKDSGGLKASVTAIGLLRDPRIRRALVLGCGLQMLQQLSGINTVMYYSASIFRFARRLSRWGVVAGWWNAYSAVVTSWRLSEARGGQAFDVVLLSESPIYVLFFGLGREKNRDRLSAACQKSRYVHACDLCKLPALDKPHACASSARRLSLDVGRFPFFSPRYLP